jgi:DsbC/DsbD-like thiol-disulfide interchange protein
VRRVRDATSGFRRPALGFAQSLTYTAASMPRHPGRVRILAVLVGALIVAGTAPGAQAPLFEPEGSKRGPARLAVAISADTPAVVPGRPVTLRLDMLPAPGIHVYAPGNSDYIPISVTLIAPAGVQVHAPVYPAGEDYVFGELKETVKVYSRAFQVRQPVVVTRAAAKAAGGSLTIAGSVRYQACDDRVCFPPATVPVSVVLPIAPRAPRGNAQ